MGKDKGLEGKKWAKKWWVETGTQQMAHREDGLGKYYKLQNNLKNTYTRLLVLDINQWTENQKIREGMRAT